MDPVMRVMANLMNEGRNRPAGLLYRAGRAGLVAKDRFNPLVQASRGLVEERLDRPRHSSDGGY